MGTFFAEPNSLLENRTYDLVLGESQILMIRPSRPGYTVNVGCRHTTGIAGIFPTLPLLSVPYFFYLFMCCPVCYADSEISVLQYPTLSLFYYHRSHRCTLNCTMLWRNELLSVVFIRCNDITGLRNWNAFQAQFASPSALMVDWKFYTLAPGELYVTETFVTSQPG